MNKREAAEFLGVSERAVERHTKKGLVTPTYHKGEDGRTAASYDRARLQRVKKQMAGAPPGQAPARREPSAPVKADKGDGGGVGGVGPPPWLVPMLAQIARSAGPPPVALESRLTLSVSEASEVSGLSRGFLLKAIHAGELKAAKGRARGWNVKRADLELWVAAL